MKTIENIREGILELEKDFNKIKDAKERVQLTERTDRLTASAHAIAHTIKARAFSEYKESEAYILGLQAEIANTGTVATIQHTGKVVQLKLSADHKTATTFDLLPEGSTVVIQDSNYLVKSFSHTYAGSTAELIPLNSKVFLTGEPVTPYSAIPANFNSATKQLTLSKFNRLQKGATLTINGQLFAPVTVIGDSSKYFCYELEVI
jgi:hypothetical protein